MGVNGDQLPVNRPHATEARNGNRDGFAYDGRHKGQKNYEPNSFGGPDQTGRPLWAPLTVSGLTGEWETPRHSEDDDFVQPGNLYRLMTEPEKERLVANLAGSISQVSRDEIAERAIANFAKADDDLGKRLSAAVAELRK